MMRVTEDCLFMRTATGSLYGGRYSMSWWATITSPFVFVFLFACEYINYRYFFLRAGYDGVFLSYFFENWKFSVGISIASVLTCFWMFIPWRTQLPIIFNRRTLRVTCIAQGKWISQPWNYVEAYIKDVTTVAVGGASANEGLLTIAFPYAGPDCPHADGRLRIGIYATQDHRQALINRGIYGAAQAWEYIRLYMREGATALPLSSARVPYRLSCIGDAISQFNPLQVLKVRSPAWLLFAVPFFLFVALPVAPLLMLGDILYMWLDRILPRRKWPQELIDACDGVWNGKDD
ncbi:hypothetical protein [Burkholderia lata]|uniref:hypothetical protein n=1 Tax=Burkholderia lata (strain ATCC 17760 / DSM 23089 / LMG 22485 / NCIMB 9086 / R18194 / 383) TaxID=482957 RepID=UPI0013DE0FB3|nr:hypothetical protein [Burkholderia lata]